MAAQSRIYFAAVGDKERLVRATHPSHVSQHVARELVTVRVATQADLEKLIGKTPVEELKAEQQELSA
jgi:hypothetical protein